MLFFLFVIIKEIRVYPRDSGSFAPRTNPSARQLSMRSLYHHRHRCAIDGRKRTNTLDHLHRTNQKPLCLLNIPTRVLLMFK